MNEPAGADDDCMVTRTVTFDDEEDFFNSLEEGRAALRGSGKIPRSVGRWFLLCYDVQNRKEVRFGGFPGTYETK